MTKIGIIDDDAVVAMVVVGAISIAALFALPKETLTPFPLNERTTTTWILNSVTAL